MKSIFKYLCLLYITLSVASCDYLDVVPDNIPTLEHAFADRYTTEQYLVTCYWGMPKSAGWNENPGLFGALEMVFNKEGQTSSGMQLGLGLNSATANRIDYWGGKGSMIRSLYAGIRECNTFLENVNGVQDLSQHEKKRMIAEVKTIKAYMHFYLLSYYGPIAPLKENTPINESTTGIRVTREHVDESFAYVIELLDEVIESEGLPIFIQATAIELGRFTKAAPYMIKAKVLTYWASPLFNGNTDYNDFIDENGEHFFNQVYDDTRWSAAAIACEEAIKVCEESGIRLYQISDYVTAKPIRDSTRIVNALRSSVSERWNAELVWGNSSYPVDGGLQSPCMPRLEQATSSSASGRMSVSLNTVEQFYSKNGVPIEEDLNYDYTNRYNLRTAGDDHRYYIHKGEQTAVLNFDREARFYSTLGFDRGKWWGNSYRNEPQNDEDAIYPKNRFGEFSSVFNPADYNATGYWPKKLVPMTTQFRDANSISYEIYPFPDFRLADLYLLCAEARNESKAAPDASVYEYIDLVRKRAGLEGVVTSWAKHSAIKDKPLSQRGMRQIIQQERKIELACEGHYFWDSHRWKTAQREQNRIIKGWNVSASDMNEYYTVTSLYTQKFTQRDYLAPIPEYDLINNPLLIQNPGW